MRLRVALALSALIALTACGGGIETTRAAYSPGQTSVGGQQVAGLDVAPASRFFDSRRAKNPHIAPVTTPVAIRSVNVVVPQVLETSEINTRYPVTDIVWRGEPMGDRHTQVAALIKAAAEAAGRGTSGQTAVADIEVLRFHGLTQKTRYSTGGVYNVHLIVTVRDAKTGAIIRPPHRFSADKKAWGADTAAKLDAQGVTEKQFVLSFLTEMFANEFARPNYDSRVVYE